MEPKYRVSISQPAKTVTDIYFDRPISTTLSQTIINLGSYQGISVFLQPTGDGYYIITTPIWDSKSILDELLLILLKNEFDRDSILVN